MQASSIVLTKHEFVKHFLMHATMTMPSCMLHPLTHLFSIVFILLSVCFHSTRDPKAARGNLGTSYAFCVEANIGGCIPSWSLSKCVNSARRGRKVLPCLALLEYYKFVPTWSNQYFRRYLFQFAFIEKNLQPEKCPFFFSYVLCCLLHCAKVKWHPKVIYRGYGLSCVAVLPW